MPEQKSGPRSRIDALVRRATQVMVFERLWPPLVLVAALVALFVALSWLRVWLLVPVPVRMLGVAAALAGVAFAAVMAFRDTRVGRTEALRRLDRDSGLPHRPVSTAEDQLATAAADPTTRALWDLHRRRIEAGLARVRVAPPTPGMAHRDPYALRMLAILVLVAAGFVAGPEKDGLLRTAFDWQLGGETGGPGFRVDAWLDPPPYTGRPPVVVFAPDGTGPAAREITIPTHSTLVIRSAGDGALAVETTGALAPVERLAAGKTIGGGDRAPPRPDVAQPKASGTAERRLLLTGDATVSIKHDGVSLGALTLHATPDAPPAIALVGTPAAGPRGSLSLAYQINDDYGVVGSEAIVSDPVLKGRPAGSRTLVAPPHLPLSLPPQAGGLGKGQTTAELADNPWAGAEVSLVLTARDEGGNVGMSPPVRIQLPVRSFTKPLARALVEQRRNLVFDPDHRDGIGLALDALMIEPDRFGTSKAIYLGLYTARERLEAARSDEDLIGLADFLWQMALRIEDGDLSPSQRDLRAAEEALKEAMKRGAPGDEIRKLTEALQQQMQKYLSELMQQAPKQQEGRADPNAKTVTPQDLQRMMKQMQDAARAGDMAEAQRLLEQLQNILENLKTAKGGQSGNQAQREMNRQMGELDRMMRDQQGVRDRTFQHGQQSRGQDGARPSPGDNPDMDEDQDGQDDDTNGMGSEPPGGDTQQQGQKQPEAGPADSALQNQQQALRQRLQDLQKRMRDLGLKGEQGLGDAEEAMKEAENALGQGRPGNRRAVEQQGRALEGLQKGANGLAQQMAEAQGDQPGQGEGQANGTGTSNGPGMAGRSGDTDPLGRKRDARGATETRGQAIDGDVAARAQRVLQELRRRLGDPSRPQGELDYLERLLQPF